MQKNTIFYIVLFAQIIQVKEGVTYELSKI